MLKIKKIKPMFTSLLTTMNMYEDDQLNSAGLIDVSKRQGTMKEYQTVVAIGDSVRNVKVGDLVSINPSNYAVRRHQEGSLKDGVITDNPVVDYRFNVVEMDNTKYLMLQDRDIDYIIEDYEEVEDPKPSKIIMPRKQKLIY